SYHKPMRYLIPLAALAAFTLNAQGVGEIRGFAFDGDGRPIPNAHVTLRGPAGQTVTSSADGSFTFASVPAGHYQVSAIEEKRELISDTSVSLDLAAGQVAEADLTVARSIKHYPRWKRILRRLDGISQ